MIAENLAHQCAIKITCDLSEDFAHPERITKLEVYRYATAINETIHVIATFDVGDTSFVMYDYYAANDVEYTYLIVPTPQATEPGVMVSVKSHFDNLFIGNLTDQYTGVLNVDFSHSLHYSRAYAQTYYSKYPHVIINGDQMYESGAVSGIFLEFDEKNCRFVTEEAGSYRRRFARFLASPESKIIKTRDGDIWHVQTNGDVKFAGGKGGAGTALSFEWTEIDSSPETGLVVVDSDGTRKAVMA